MARDFVAASSQYLSGVYPTSDGYPLTLACWYYSDSAQTAALLEVEDSSKLYYHQRLVLVATGAVLSAQTQDGTNFPRANSTSSYSNSVWQHACGVFSAANSRTIYLNGGSKGTNTASITMTGLNTVAVARTGGTTPGAYFDGKIAEAAVWNAALTDDEALILSKGFSPRFVRPNALMFYAPIIGRKSPETELRGGNSLTVSGATQYQHPRIIIPGPQHIAHYSSALPTDKTYSKGFDTDLPLDDTDMSTAYTVQNYTDVATSDDTRVSEDNHEEQYTVHLFKDDVSATGVDVTWEGQSSEAPSSFTVTLQVYNYNSTTWETLDSDSATGDSTDFTLTGSVNDTTNYLSGGRMAFRVHQFGDVGGSTPGLSTDYWIVEAQGGGAEAPAPTPRRLRTLMGAGR